MQLTTLMSFGSIAVQKYNNELGIAKYSNNCGKPRTVTKSIGLLSTTSTAEGVVLSSA